MDSLQTCELENNWNFIVNFLSTSNKLKQINNYNLEKSYERFTDVIDTW